MPTAVPVVPASPVPPGRGVPGWVTNSGLLCLAEVKRLEGLFQIILKVMSFNKENLNVQWQKSTRSSRLVKPYPFSKSSKKQELLAPFWCWKTCHMALPKVWGFTSRTRILTRHHILHGFFGATDATTRNVHESKRLSDLQLDETLFSAPWGTWLDDSSRWIHGNRAFES